MKGRIKSTSYVVKPDANHVVVGARFGLLGRGSSASCSVHRVSPIPSYPIAIGLDAVDLTREKSNDGAPTWTFNAPNDSPDRKMFAAIQP